MKSSVLRKPSGSAPWYHVPRSQVVAVEHPCVIKNVDKAIETLGGDQAIKAFLQTDQAEKPIPLKFHPEDAFSQPIMSVNCQTNNVLLRVNVPRRTGRKRKRGSDGPFAESEEEAPELGKKEKRAETKKDARYVLRSLRDNNETYQVEVVAQIPRSHTFRTMPDFAYSTSESKFLNQMREKVVPFQYPQLSDFQLDPARGVGNKEVIPPPVLSAVSYPVNYAYRQNPAIKAYLDPSTGSRRLYNTQAPIKIYTQQCQWDVAASEIPTGAAADAPPFESEGHNFHGLVIILRTIFAQRPIWTRRGLANQLPANAPMFLAKYAIAYVAYVMRSGPWRDTYIRFGVDPRSDRVYRKYQTLMLQLVSSKKPSGQNKRYEGSNLLYWRSDPDRNSHIFTGRGGVPPDGKSWQLCDLHDPLLSGLVDIPDIHIRHSCDDRYFGWYQNGTWCKLKVILKTKVDLMLDDIDADADAEFELRFNRFLALPESYNIPSTITTTAAGSGTPTPPPSSAHHRPTDVFPSPWQAAGPDGDPLLGFLPRNASKMELEWAAQYRALCRAPQGKLPPSGRLSRSKQSTRASFIGHGDCSGKAQGGDSSTVENSVQGNIAGDAGIVLHEQDENSQLQPGDGLDDQLQDEEDDEDDDDDDELSIPEDEDEDEGEAEAGVEIDNHEDDDDDDGLN